MSELGALLPWINRQITDDNGVPVAGGWLTFKAAGLNVLQDTFSTAQLTPANTNPLQLDSGGRATVFLSPGLAYDITVSAPSAPPNTTPGATLWTLEAVSQSPGSADITITVTLTNNQIKALPTTPITIVAAPGAGFRLVARAAQLVTHFSDGAYTNINAAAVLGLNYASGAFAFSLVPNNAAITNTTVGATALTGFFTNAEKIANLVPYANTEDLDEVGAVASILDLADVENQAFTISIDNGGSGALTGGDPANTMTVTATYTVETI